MKIDIGGTPEKVMESNKFRIARLNGEFEENLVAILDPFDLSRDQRKLYLGDYKTPSIKFSVDVPNGQTNLNSEAVKPPKSKDCATLLESAENSVIGKMQTIYGKRIDISKIKERYNLFKKNIIKLADFSSNLREFMNGLLKLLAPNLEIIKLEDILSRNSSMIYNILEKTDIPVRAICPSCNCFVQMFLRGKTPCCNIPGDSVIKCGKYIPQEGFFAVITYLCGYSTYDNSQEKVEQSERIMTLIERKGQVLITYKPQEKRTMFESYLLGY